MVVITAGHMPSGLIDGIARHKMSGSSKMMQSGRKGNMGKRLSRKHVPLASAGDVID
jgi:hypothetical protein